MRIEDTPDLFGCGVGGSTGFSVTCEWCGEEHNKDTDPEEPSTEGDSVLFIDFAGKEICDCCFEAIEKEIIHRMRDILPWYRRMIDKQRNRLDKADSDLKAIDIRQPDSDEIEERDAESILSGPYDCERLKNAIRQYANTRPLDQKIQSDLLAITGAPHYHRASIEGDSCSVCGRHSTHEVHLKQL